MPTELQKKDELRRELRILEAVKESFAEITTMSHKQEFTYKIVCDRIEDIQKALED